MACQCMPQTPCWLEVMASTCCDIMQTLSSERSCPWNGRLEDLLLRTLCCISQVTESMFGLCVCSLTGWLLRVAPSELFLSTRWICLNLGRICSVYSQDILLTVMSSPYPKNCLPHVWFSVTLEGIAPHMSYSLVVPSSEERKCSLPSDWHIVASQQIMSEWVHFQARSF